MLNTIRSKFLHRLCFCVRWVIPLFLLSGWVHAIPSHWIVFGDSLSDSGNLFSLTGGLAPPSPPYAGQFSNGPVWVEHLASANGLVVHDVFVDGGLEGPLHVNNFAVGGSFTTAYALASPPFPPLAVDNTNDIAAIAGGLPPPGLPGLSQQLERFDLLTPSGVLSVGGAPEDALYVVWAGANDLVFSNLLNLSPFPTAATPGETIAPVAAANVQSTVLALATKGAQRFLVSNLPDIGATPFAVGTGRSVELSAASDRFNTELMRLLGELTLDITVLDVHELFNDVLANPLDFGFLESGPCVVPGVARLVCRDPATAIYWDPLHPTSATHAVLASGFSAAAAPEPSTLALMSVTLLLMLIRARRTLPQAA